MLSLLFFRAFSSFVPTNHRFLEEEEEEEEGEEKEEEEEQEKEQRKEQATESLLDWRTVGE